MYEKIEAEVTAACGSELTMVVCFVDIDRASAERLFEEGENTGTWGWKSKRWTCRSVQHLEEVRAAARFFYGWDEGTERVTSLPGGKYLFEAFYAC